MAAPSSPDLLLDLGLGLWLQAIHEFGGVHVQPISQSDEAGQTQVSLTPLNGTHEGEVQAYTVGKSHLTEAKLRTPCADSLP